jgi:tetratricopeptide (TPR) repeat protein
MSEVTEFLNEKPNEIAEINQLISTRRITEAETFCRRLLERNKSLLEARRLLGVCLIRTGKLEEAEEHLFAVRDQQPANSMVLVNIGYLREEQGRLDEAEIALMLALMLDPGNDFAHGRYGNLMRRMERQDAFDTFYRKLIAMFPTEALQAEPFYRSLLSVIGPLKEPKNRRAHAARYAKIAPPISPSQSDATMAQRADHLRQGGFASLGRLLDAEQVEEIHQYFRTKQTYNSLLPDLGDGVLRPIEETSKKSNYACYQSSDIVKAPHLMEIFSNPAVTQLAGHILDCQPTLYSVNVWWSFPQETPSQHAQSFHRDIDDFMFITLFIYLTDVDMDSGAHVYCRETHDFDILEANLARRHPGHNDVPGLTQQFFDETYGMDGLMERYLAHNRETVCGPAGTAFMADTFGLHKGFLPKHRPRLMCWARFGLHEIYRRGDPIPRRSLSVDLPNDVHTKYTNRMYVCD